SRSCPPACQRRATPLRRASCASSAPAVSRRGSASSFIFRLVAQVALHLRRSQKLLDSFCFVESLVDAEADVRRKFQVNVPRDLAAQEALIALERSQHSL